MRFQWHPQNIFGVYMIYIVWWVSWFTLSWRADNMLFMILDIPITIGIMHLFLYRFYESRLKDLKKI